MSRKGKPIQPCSQYCVYESQETQSPQRCLHPNPEQMCIRSHGNRPAHVIVVMDLEERVSGTNKIGQPIICILTSMMRCRDGRQEGLN